MSDSRIKDIGEDISLTLIEIVMRDRTPKTIGELASQINDNNFNIIVILYQTDGTHWVLVTRREGGPVFYFDSFGVKTPPLFLEEYVDLGSNERIQQYDESYCGSYCLYIIYLIDRGFRINSALNILVYQCNYPEMYNECFCLGCNVNDNVFDNDNVIDNDIDNDNDLQSSFANNVNDNDNVKDNDNDLRSSLANNINDNDNDNDDFNDNDLRSSFANNVNDNDNVNQGTCSASHEQSSFADDNFIHLFDEKHGEAWTKYH